MDRIVFPDLCNYCGKNVDMFHILNVYGEEENGKVVTQQQLVCCNTKESILKTLKCVICNNGECSKQIIEDRNEMNIVYHVCFESRCMEMVKSEYKLDKYAVSIVEKDVALLAKYVCNSCNNKVEVGDTVYAVNTNVGTFNGLTSDRFRYLLFLCTHCCPSRKEGTKFVPEVARQCFICSTLSPHYTIMPSLPSLCVCLCSKSCITVALPILGKMIQYLNVEKLLTKVCGYCNKGLDKVKKCSQCRCTYYCNEECQRADWSKHKQYCIKP